MEKGQQSATATPLVPDDSGSAGDNESLLMRFFNPSINKRDLIMKRWTTAITAIVKHGGNPIGSIRQMSAESRDSLVDLRSRIMREDTTTSFIGSDAELDAAIAHHESLNRNDESRDQGISSPAAVTDFESSRCSSRQSRLLGMRSISRIWEEMDDGSDAAAKNTGRSEAGGTSQKAESKIREAESTKTATGVCSHDERMESGVTQPAAADSEKTLEKVQEEKEMRHQMESSAIPVRGVHHHHHHQHQVEQESAASGSIEQKKDLSIQQQEAKSTSESSEGAAGVSASGKKKGELHRIICTLALFIRYSMCYASFCMKSTSLKSISE